MKRYWSVKCALLLKWQRCNRNHGIPVKNQCFASLPPLLFPLDCSGLVCSCPHGAPRIIHPTLPAAKLGLIAIGAITPHLIGYKLEPDLEGPTVPQSTYLLRMTCCSFFYICASFLLHPSFCSLIMLRHCSCSRSNVTIAVRAAWGRNGSRAH